MKKLVVFLLLPTLFVACTKLKKDSPEEKAEKPKKETHVGKMTREVLDLDVVKKDHPNWVEIDPQLQGNDPLTQAATGYNALTGDLGKLAFDKWIREWQALNLDRGGFPTFAEAKQFVERDSQGLPRLRPYDHWVYDDTAGTLHIVRDPEHYEKERIK